MSEPALGRRSTAWYVCRVCGGVVSDRELHRAWHDLVRGLNSTSDQAATFLAETRTVADAAATAAADARARADAAAARVTTTRLQSTPLPLIAVNTAYDQAVTWRTALPSATYHVEHVVQVGLTVVGRVQTTVKSRTATGCVITVTSPVLLAAGAQLLTAAIHTTEA